MRCILKFYVMNRVSYAFRSFFSILFGGTLPDDIAQAFGWVKPSISNQSPAATPAPAAVPKPQASPTDGAVQILGILQRESRLIDFLMEDIGPYSDEQIGAAVRDVQQQAKVALDRYIKLVPVVDAVEETPVLTAGLEGASYKLIGNVPASGKAPSGLLRHKGWKAEKAELPASKPSAIVAPAELEVE
jgi:hypothetical protein